MTQVDALVALIPEKAPHESTPSGATPRTKNAVDQAGGGRGKDLNEGGGEGGAEEMRAGPTKRSRQRGVGASGKRGKY